MKNLQKYHIPRKGVGKGHGENLIAMGGLH